VSAPGVLLLNPRMSPQGKARIPLSLLNLGAVLEGRRPWRILDGNVEADLGAAALAELRARPYGLVGVSVMPGPQVGPAIAVSAAIRAAFPALPIVWGGYFPTLYPEAAINAPYVDFLVRGQGEQPLLDLLGCLERDPPPLGDVARLTWKQGGRAVHNPEGALLAPESLPPLPYERLGDVRTFLQPSFMGARTAVYQIALGCRYKCDFCGVVSMWNGKTLLEPADRMFEALRGLRDRWGADAIQFFDNNFFDREDSGQPVLDALVTLGLPWWCYARADTMAKFSAATWEKIRKSRLRMAYFGAESASDEVLARMRKGSRAEHTLEVVMRCREYGVVPELSFILGGPDDPEGEVEKTLGFIRRIKELHPPSEIVLLFYSPTPQRQRGPAAREAPGARLPVLGSYGPGRALPSTPEEWAQPRWVSWVSHQDAPWMSARLRQRVKDFARVLACRFPTLHDYRTPAWGKSVLRNLARWRYASGRYQGAWELKVAQRLIPLHDPVRESL
jgi:radical SAM superfamily enzyme YgiQ (UPF0313 family)